jgi:ParB family chromosome partitioning protein
VEELAALAKPAAKADGPALERLAKTIADRDFGVARAAYDAVLEIKGKTHQDTHLAAMATTHPALRAQGAKDAGSSARAPDEKLRSTLAKLLEDTDAGVRVAAIEALDQLLPKEHGAIAIGLQSSHLDLRVRAAELLAIRREESIIDPMRALLADKDLLLRMPPPVIQPLRQRAAAALANLGPLRLLKYFATELVKDDDPLVREQAARGLSNASRRGEEGYLLDLLGHQELPVRSWAAEGLARLGDPRALPVLVGTLRHDHPPIRIGAILSFAALGPEGYGGMLQGLEDPSREVQRVVLAVILARDLRAFRRDETPDLLTSALSSQRPEVRFAAARALELRIDAAQYIGYLIEVLMPDRPERAADMERWPDEDTRARLMVGLAEALAGDRPEQRYAAAQALRLRGRPIDYFREIQRAASPRSVKAPWVPDTTPRAPVEAAEKKKGPLGLLRRLFASGSDEQAPPAEPSSVPQEEQQRLRLLAFGAYVGLLRQATADDEAHRVRRDAIERLVELTGQGHVSLASATPALARALDDPNHLVRQAAFAALKKTYKGDPETPLALALASSSADVIRAALDELAAGGEGNRARIVKALDSRVAQARKYAFDLLEKSSPPGSLEPLLAALGSEHADIRIGVLERLATSQDARVSRALGSALDSDHDDLRLRAAEMLAERKDDRAADALTPWLRAEDRAIAERARTALSHLGSPAAVRALATRLEDDVPEAERIALAEAIAGARPGQAPILALAALFADEHERVRTTAFGGCLTLVGPRSDVQRERGKPKPKPRDPELSALFLEAAIGSRHADVRLLAARQLDDLSDAPRAGTLLAGMFGDRDRGVRAAAVWSYARHVEEKRLPARPLEDVLRSGARETMLSAAWGLAHEGNGAALRPLLLFARAGEEQERQGALLGLGVLGDKRALAELEVVAQGGTEEAPAELMQQVAALEALGRLVPKLGGDERDRVVDRIDSSVGNKEPWIAVAAVRALRWMAAGTGRPAEQERATARLVGILSERSSSEAEQIEAAKALGRLGAESAERALAEALNDDSDEVRWAAREALEEVFPKDRTRVEFLAVESHHGDISEPAAAYLANEGDAGLLLAKLTKLGSTTLRQRLRFGLMRRPSIPTGDLERLLADASPEARADAAWVAGGQAKTSDSTKLAPALVLAAKRAERGYLDAARSGKARERDSEERAWLYALWAGREIDAAGVRLDARRWVFAKEVPTPIRIEAAFALHGGSADDKAALKKALGDRDTEVRTAAATSLAPVSDVMALVTAPLDPVRLGLAADGAQAPSKHTVDTSEARRVLLPFAFRDGRAKDMLLAILQSRDARLDAIAALGRDGTDGAIETLTRVASKEATREEDVRKAAFRALRRAQRVRARRQAIAKAKEPSV